MTSRPATTCLTSLTRLNSQIALSPGPFQDPLQITCATWLVTAGVPVNITQRVMGHQSPTTTLRIYTHVGQDYRDAVSAAFRED